jgi:hypothetical protein
MRHVIDSTTVVIIWETRNGAGDVRRAEDGEPTEHYSYLIAYRDRACQLRESEPQSGFISPDHCVQDARRSIELGELDLTPEPPKPTPEPPITVKYHHHICKVGCPNHRCVNPACYSKEEFPRKVAEIICPNCGDKTGPDDPFGYMRVETFIPLVTEQASAA